MTFLQRGVAVHTKSDDPAITAGNGMSSLGPEIGEIGDMEIGDSIYFWFIRRRAAGWAVS